MGEKIFDAYHNEVELTEEQKACLKYTGDRTLLVKGLAGSGKSFVLMQIAERYLKAYGHRQKNKVAFFTFQNTLVSSTREQLNVNAGEDEGVVVSTVNSYVKSIYEGLVSCRKAPKQVYPNTKKKDKDLPKRLHAVEMAINNHKKKHGDHRFHKLPYEFWLDEFDWMKDMNIGKDDSDAYFLYKRKGRGNKYRFRSMDYITAFQIYVLYLEYQEKSKQGDWADQPMFLIRNAHLISEEFKFEHILIDEAQDLSLAQMLALMTLIKDGGNMVVAMDANQKIHGKYWTTKLLGIESTTKKLTKSKRTTIQIDALAESVRSKNDEILSDDDKSVRAIPEDNGPMPRLVHLNNSVEEQKYVVSQVMKLQKANPKATIGIITAQNKYITTYGEWLASAGISHEVVKKDSTFSLVKPGVKIASAYGSKGLEFNFVIIPKFVEGNFPFSYCPDDEEEYVQYMIKMRNLVYVSMTRAKNMLIITWSGDKGSRFLADMDPKLYEKSESPFVVKKMVPPQQSVPHDKDEQNREGEGLVSFLQKKGLRLIDMRSRRGALWLIGGDELRPIILETEKLYGAKWVLRKGGGGSTGYVAGWYTKSKK